MIDSQKLFECSLYLLIYSFLGWVVETIYYAATRRRFLNRGFTSLPMILSYGTTFAMLAFVLPTLRGNHVIALIGTMVIVAVVDALFDWLTRRIGSRANWEPERDRLFSGKALGVAASAAIAAAYYLVYLIVHPVLMGFVLLIPDLILKIVVGVMMALLLVDFVSVAYALRTGHGNRFEDESDEARRRFADKISERVWARLRKAYPGIEKAPEEQLDDYVFARGLCWDKLIWVFLVSALIGDLIEMLFCRLTGGVWMSRSSVLYGPFSIVWGMGAVVLTVTLQRLADKDDRHVFLAGFVVGGAYEYMCSVFTELVFGTVFWDYSHMPLNIGGRTNVLYCFFWGALSVIWIKIIYPRMSGLIEKLPAITGKLMTWAIVVVMLCNGLLTGAAMLRYNSRAVRPEAANVIDSFLDRHYDDAFMEERWPNMVVTQKTEKTEEAAS